MASSRMKICCNNSPQSRQTRPLQEAARCSAEEVRIRRCRHLCDISGRSGKSTPGIIRSGLDKDEYFYEFEDFISVIERGGIESGINSHEASLVNREILDAALGSGRC